MAKAVGLAMGLFGWPPCEAWNATPRDLLLALEARLAFRHVQKPPALSRADYETLKARLERA